MECELQALGIGAILRCGDGGVGGSDLEEDGRLLIGNGGLGSDLVGERIVPREIDTNLGETELEEFELAEILVEEIAACELDERWARIAGMG